MEWHASEWQNDRERELVECDFLIWKTIIQPAWELFCKFKAVLI